MRCLRASCSSANMWTVVLAFKLITLTTAIRAVLFFRANSNHYLLISFRNSSSWKLLGNLTSYPLFSVLKPEESTSLGKQALRKGQQLAMQVALAGGAHCWVCTQCLLRALEDSSIQQASGWLSVPEQHSLGYPQSLAPLEPAPLCPVRADHLQPCCCFLCPVPHITLSSVFWRCLEKDLLKPSSNLVDWYQVCSDFTWLDKLEIGCTEVLHVVSRRRIAALRRTAVLDSCLWNSLIWWQRYSQFLSMQEHRALAISPMHHLLSAWSSYKACLGKC